MLFFVTRGTFFSDFRWNIGFSGDKTTGDAISHLDGPKLPPLPENLTDSFMEKMEMKSKSMIHTLEVWGDFACFSRPEMAVERYSYPCPTPSAARGVFEAVYFKPAFYWQVTQVDVLAYPNYIALRRNEVKDKISESSIKKWMAGKEEPSPLFADADKSLTGTDQKGRTQRQTMAIRSPHYRLHARIVPRKGFESEQAAYVSQFVRRASQGKCFQQPYLGCKEFVCFFRYIEDTSGLSPAIPYTQDLGYMLYDVFDLSQNNHEKYVKDWKGVKASVSMFCAKVEAGVLQIPTFESEQVLKKEGA